MNRDRCLNSFGNHTAKWKGFLTTLMGAVILAAAATARNDDPEPPSGHFGGIYKVTSSTDPIFPATRTREYFLDFGQGIQSNKTSGSVAVSERQNPHVKVRILTWQHFPEQGSLVIGNPTAAGARGAVVRAAWRIRSIAHGAILQRGPYQIILHRADPQDY